MVSYPELCLQPLWGTAQVALQGAAADGEAGWGEELTGWALPGPGRLGRWSRAADRCRSGGLCLGRPRHARCWSSHTRCTLSGTQEPSRGILPADS